MWALGSGWTSLGLWEEGHGSEGLVTSGQVRLFKFFVFPGLPSSAFDHASVRKQRRGLCLWAPRAALPPWWRPGPPQDLQVRAFLRPSPRTRSVGPRVMAEARQGPCPPARPSRPSEVVSCWPETQPRLHGRWTHSISSELGGSAVSLEAKTPARDHGRTADAARSSGLSGSPPVSLQL